jgi:hypothetical protein
MRTLTGRKSSELIGKRRYGGYSRGDTSNYCLRPGRGYGGLKSDELFDKAEELEEAFLIRIVQNRMTVSRPGKGNYSAGQPERHSRTGGGTPAAACSVYDKAALYSQSG